MANDLNTESALALFRSLKALERWVEDHGYRGYEPFDGLSSPLRALTFGSLFLDRILMQAVRQSPVNLRPFLGIKPLDSTIGQGYMASGYLTMLQATGDHGYADKARRCLSWLIENRSPGYDDMCWGKHFDFASRGGRYPRFEPITVWTTLIGTAFLDAYETLGDEAYLAVAQSVCRWLLGLAREETGSGTCLAYTATGEPNSIHNHSMLAAGLLARTASHARDREYLQVAREVITYSCTRQRRDGAWYYGEEAMFHWIDNFHTGYDLDGLKAYIESTGDRSFDENLRRGFDFYVGHFFEDSGRPKYYHDRTYPVDSQCISQSIDTLASFADLDDRALPLSVKVAGWAMAHMQDRRGFFYYRQYPLVKARTPMLHWAQATTYKAMSALYRRLTNVDSRSRSAAREIQ